MRARSPISWRPISTPTSASMVGTFAPTRAVWSFDNRTAGFRLCGEGSKAIRIECRIGGADLNPYLAFAALIAAGLEGIEEKTDARAAVLGRCLCRHGSFREIPKTLARGDGLPRRIRVPARSVRRRRRRALRAHRQVGAVRVRPPYHRLGAQARLRALLNSLLQGDSRLPHARSNMREIS